MTNPTPAPLDLDALDVKCNQSNPLMGDFHARVILYRGELRALIIRAREADSWRCFHCEEVFADRTSAAAHFGYSEIADPACRIHGGLAAAYRELEALWSRCLNECCEHTTAYHAKESERRAALVREEQKGYDKGVSDMQAELATLRAAVAKAMEGLNIGTAWTEEYLTECKRDGTIPAEVTRVLYGIAKIDAAITQLREAIK